MLAVAPPASAHETPKQNRYWAYREGGNPGECMWAGEFQDHARVQVLTQVYREFVLAPWKHPAPYNSCASESGRPGGTVQQRGEWYKNGAWPPCLIGGWQRNSHQASGIFWDGGAGWNAWPWCNNGPCVYVYISHDVWHKFQKSIGNTNWVETAARPATFHEDFC